MPWRELAGEGLRLETVYLGRQGTRVRSLRLAARAVGLADQLGVQAVLTNAVRYVPRARRLSVLVLVHDEGDGDAGGADLPGELQGCLQLRSPGGSGGRVDLLRGRAASSTAASRC